jgi:signal transduction histidine kinase
LSELKSNFVSMVSHEYRNPLEIIQSSSDILLRYHDRLAPEKRVQHLQGIQKSVKRMSDLMEEVLLLGKVEAGQIEFKPQPLDLPAFCRGLVEEVSSATGHHCPVDFELDAVPASAQGDESLLRLIFINLLSNALKYSAAGRPVRWILSEQQGLAVFRVVDQGLGIPLADQSRLFQAFHRGRNTGHLPGTGWASSL